MPTDAERLDAYAGWIRANQASKGSPQFEKVAAAYRSLRSGGPQVMDRAAFDRQEGSFEMPQPSLGSRVGRQVGLGSRAALEAAGALPGVVYDAAGAVTNIVIMGLNELGADLPYVKRAGEHVAAIGDAAGLPTPNTDNERLMSSALRAGGTMLMSPGASVRNVALAGLGGLAGEETYQATGNPWLAGGVDMAVNFGVPGGAALTRTIARGGNQGAARMRDNIADFEKVGATPTLGQATGATRIQGIEGLIAKTPGGVAAMRRQGQNTADAVARSMSRVTDDVTAVEGGAALRKGLAGANDRYERVANRIYGDAYDQAENAARRSIRLADLENTRNLLGAAKAELRLAPESAKSSLGPTIGRIDEILADIAKSYDTPLGQERFGFANLRAARTRLGEDLKTAGITGTSGSQQTPLHALYAALTKDMNRYAARWGAQKAINLGDRYWRAANNRKEKYIDPLTRTLDDEDLLKAVMRKDAKSVFVARRSVGEDEWKLTAQAIANELLKATPGQQNAEGTVASLDRFLTNYNALGKPTQDAIFGRLKGSGEMSEHIRTIARVADSVKAANKVMANPSGTATVSAQASAGAAFLLSLLRGDLVTASIVAGGVGTVRGTAGYLTNPKTVKWLADSTRVPLDRAPAMIARLKALAETDSDARELLSQIEAGQHTTSPPEPR